MAFISSTFLIGLVAAAGPLIIHLINRRRFRTVSWAAMEFLREAVQRNRRILELRDLLLLLLRTLAVAFFVLAMARPYWARQRQAGAGASDQPVHAVLVLDNSMSMGYTQLDQSLLDLARAKAAAFIEALPRGSQVSLIPMAMADPADAQVRDLYAVKDDALEALRQIKVVDRAARAGEAAERVRAACQNPGAVRTKRVVFLTDLQRHTWAGQDLKDYLKDLDEVQVMNLAPETRSNSWVADFRLRDGVADAEAPAVFTATLRHEGDQPRRRVRVSLKIDDAVADERFVDLLPGQSLQLTFKHKFEVAGTSKEPLFAAARLELTPDRLPQDDFRQIVVPVVAEVPVVFADQYGAQENPHFNRYGETFLLRRLLAPRTLATAQEKQLIAVRHRTLEQLNREVLKDARLAVVAGVRAPTATAVQLLREYVEQGGSLVLAAGAEFDPQAWSALGWLDGAGILPAPLKARPIGALPAAGQGEPPRFGLAAASLRDDMFQLDLPETEARDLLERPFFYKAVSVDLEAAALAEPAVRQRFDERRQWLQQSDANEKRWAEAERAGRLAAADAQQRDADRKARDALRAGWLAWSSGAVGDDAGLDLDRLVARTRPRVMGRYNNQEVFAVRREIGKGRVIFFSTGMYPQWNSLAVEDSVILLDQVLRTLLTQSFPARTIGPVPEVRVPLEARDLGATFSLQTPEGGEPQTLRPESLDGVNYGLRLRGVAQRGLYRITRGGGAGAEPAVRAAAGPGHTDAAAPWAMLFAVNGPPEESELAAVDEREVAAEAGAVNVQFLGSGDAIRLDGRTILGYDFWKYLLAAALVCLLAEMVVVALAQRQRPQAAARGARPSAAGAGANDAEHGRGRPWHTEGGPA